MQGIKPSSHYFIVIIVLLGVLLRLFGISEQGLTGDENTWTKRSSEYVVQILEPLKIDYMKKYEGYDGYPINDERRDSYPFNIKVGAPHPGSGNSVLMGFSIYLFGEDTSSFTMNFMPDYVAARLPQIIFGSSAIIVLYLLGIIFLNQNIALVASGIFSIEPLAVGLSRLAHLDMALTFGLLAANLFYLLGCMKDKKYFIYSGVFWGWSLSLKPYAWFFLVAIISWQVLVIVLSRLGIKSLDDLSTQRLIYLVKGHINLVIIGVLVFILFYPNLWSNFFPNLITYFKSFLSLPQVSMDNTKNFPTIKSYYITYGLLHITIPMLIFCLIGILGIGRDVKLKDNTAKPHKETALLYLFYFTFIYILMLSLPGGKKEARNMVVIFPYLSLLGAIGFLFITEVMHKILPRKVDIRVTYTILFLILVPSYIISCAPYYPYLHIYTNTMFGNPQEWKPMDLIAGTEADIDIAKYIQNKGHENITCFFSPQGLKRYLPQHEITGTSDIEKIKRSDIFVYYPKYYFGDPNSDLSKWLENKKPTKIFRKGKLEMARIYENFND